MDPAPRLAVELPPVPASGPGSLEPWWELARVAVRAGANVVWFAGGPTGRGLTDRDPERRDPRDPEHEGFAPVGARLAGGPHPLSATWCDACTIAAASAPRVDAALVGVVSTLPIDRHPALIAREVTTLDVLTDGRAALLLRWDAAGAARDTPGSRAGLLTATDYLGEALAVCRTMFRDDDPVFEGRFLHVSGAVNRPAPSRRDRPPLFVEVPAGAASLLAADPASSLLLRQTAVAGATLVCDDEPGQVAEWLALLDVATAGLWTGRDAAGSPGVVVRATPTSLTPVADTGVRPAAARARAGKAHAAGAGGVVVPLSVNGGGIGRRTVVTAGASQVAEDLRAWFAPWGG